MQNDVWDKDLNGHCMHIDLAFAAMRSIYAVEKDVTQLKFLKIFLCVA